MARRAVRPRASSRRAGAGAGARPHDAWLGGAMMRRVVTAIVGLLAVGAVQAGCANTAEPDAYGNVEATEVVVGAEAAGRLVSYTAVEGAALAAGAVAATIDAEQLGYERLQLTAQRDATASRGLEVRQQIAALESQRSAIAAQRDAGTAQRAALAAQLEIARRSHERIKRLFDQQAATAQQLDQAERDERTLVHQLAAQ